MFVSRTIKRQNGVNHGEGEARMAKVIKVKVEQELLRDQNYDQGFTN